MSEQRELLDEHIKRSVAKAALRRIHGIIEADARDQRSTIRFAGITTGLVLGVFFTCLLGFGLARIVAYGHGAEPGVGDIVAVAVLAMLGVFGLTSAHYFVRAYPHSYARHGRIAALASVVAALAALAIYLTAPVQQ